MKPALSVIIPHRNHQKVLPRALDSLCAQKGVSFEVLIVDDCSDESCDALVEAYRAKGLDIRALYQDKQVFTKEARLIGVREAQGHAIAFLDSDDTFMDADTLAVHTKMLEDNNADIVHFRTMITHENGEFQRYYFVADPFGMELSQQQIFEQYVKTDIHGTVIWNKIYSKTLWETITPVAAKSKVLRYVEDIYLTSLCMLHAKKYIASNLVGHNYYYIPKDRTDCAERGVYSLFMYEEMLPYLRSIGIADATVTAYARFLAHYISMCAGRLGVAVGNETGIAIPDSAVNTLLTHVSATDLIKVLLIGNHLNAEKIVSASRILRTGSATQSPIFVAQQK